MQESNIKLVLPSMEYQKEIKVFKAGLIGGDSFAGSNGLQNDITIPEWIKLCEDNRQGKNLPDGYVPATTFIAIREYDRKMVGTIQIRHSFTPHLFSVGGHIGYMTAVDERRKGYCTEMLRLCLPYCKQELGIDKVLITCKKPNTASAKVIIANGGVLENEVEHDGEIFQRYWIDV